MSNVDKPGGVIGAAWPGYFSNEGQLTMTYHPPSCLQLTGQYPAKMGGGSYWFTMYCVPMSPGVSRFFAIIRTDSTALPIKLGKLKPTWIDHAYYRLVMWWCCCPQ